MNFLHTHNKVNDEACNILRTSEINKSGNMYFVQKNKHDFPNEFFDRLNWTFRVVTYKWMTKPTVGILHCTWAKLIVSLIYTLSKYVSNVEVLDINEI